MSVTSDQALRETEILVLRQMSDNLIRLNHRLDGYEDKQDKIFQYIGEIKTTLAVQTERQLVVNEIKVRLDDLERHHQQSQGAHNLVRWLKDFGPWIGTIILLAWGLFIRKPA